ncbi:MAG: helix-turn-helix transcriptional regulator [Rhodoglobus sp.]|nr:helix-turn-helix transcriptional regulator [Rhodoglobus sp.]
MELRHRLGTNVRRLRESAQLSQEELAFRAGMHVTYLSGVENGRRNPSLGIIVRLANALDIDPVELFGLSNEPSDQPLG